MNRPHRLVRLLAAPVAALFALAACGGGSSGSSATTSGSSAASVAGSASGSASGSGSGSAAAAAFPVSLTHAFGTTEIPAEPARVVTLGWGSSEAALAMGEVPVAIEKQSYGANADGVLPWTAAKLTDLGAATPTLLTSGDAPAYEEIIQAEPDLILAPYSGITADQYELLADIAPTVAYEKEPWTTPWRDVITTVGTALGQSEQADEVLAELDEQLADAAAAHPEFAGKSIAAVWDSQGTFYVYKPADARVDFLLDLGFVSAPAVDALANGDSSFYYTLSYEQLDKLDSDVLVSYHDTPEEASAFLTAAHTQPIPAVESGAVAQVVGTEFIAAVSPPTALSLTWGFDELLTALSAAANKATA